MKVRHVKHFGKQTSVLWDHEGQWDLDCIDRLLLHMSGVIRVVFGVSEPTSVSIHRADRMGNWRGYEELVFVADTMRELTPLVRLLNLWLSDVYSEGEIRIGGAHAGIIFLRICTRIARQVEGLQDKGVEFVPYTPARLRVPMLKLLSGQKPFPK